MQMVQRSGSDLVEINRPIISNDSGNSKIYRYSYLNSKVIKYSLRKQIGIV